MENFFSPGSFLILGTLFAVVAICGDMLAGDNIANAAGRHDAAARRMQFQWYVAHLMWALCALLCLQEVATPTVAAVTTGSLVLCLLKGRELANDATPFVWMRYMLPMLLLCLSAASAVAGGLPYHDPDGFTAFEAFIGVFGASVAYEAAGYRVREPQFCSPFMVTSTTY
jgi:hypothetical protein